MLYKILIEETISQMYEIEADSIDEARKLTAQGYREGKMVLESGDIESAQYTIFDAKGDHNLTEWEKIF